MLGKLNIILHIVQLLCYTATGGRSTAVGCSTGGPGEVQYWGGAL
jgi:hypothetical protein